MDLAALTVVMMGDGVTPSQHVDVSYYNNNCSKYIFNLHFKYVALHPERECLLFEVDNGEVSITHTGAGGTANVSCNQCYHLEGPSTLKCTERMKWDNLLPTCKRKPMSYVTVVQNFNLLFTLCIINTNPS